MRPGVLLQGRYEIVEALGTGGQGAVFAAVDRRLGIRVAVKYSNERLEHLRQAFVREARLLASLRHPSLPVVSDHFVQPDGQYLVLELVPGEDLGSLLRRQGRTATVDEAITWADQLLDALAYLHGQTPPIIHRDIKPGNLRVRPDGRVMLLDFGLAKGRPAHDDDGSAPISLHGYSGRYAPPEQILGRGTDARSDLYALGATLYFLLSRHAPADAAVREHRRYRAGDPLRPLTAYNPAVPLPLARAIHRALELDPSARFQSAAEMRRAMAPLSARGVGRAGARPATDPEQQGAAGAPEGYARGRRTADDDPPTLIRARALRPPGRGSAPPSPAATPPASSPPGPDDDPGLTPALGSPLISPADLRETPTDRSTPPPFASRPSHLPPDGLRAASRGPGASASGAPASPPVVPAGSVESPASSVDGLGRRLGEGFHLALAHGEQRQDRWPLPTDRPAVIGRSAEGTPTPDVDLRPDRMASRQHARIWRAEHHWWIEDIGSRRGTVVDGRLLPPHTPTVLRPWSQIQCGETMLFLAPPGWRRLRAGDLTLDLELVGAVSSALHHAGLPVVGRLVARNQGTASRPASTVQLALEPCFGPVTATIPPLRPASSIQVPLPPIALRFDVLEGQFERSRRRLVVMVDGDARLGEAIECWLLPHNEWSTLPEHQRALATFVLPNHPAVAAVASEVSAAVDGDAPAAEILVSLFAVLAERWQLAYRLEPAHWATDSQKVRLPHGVLLDDGARHGEGTCLDLALLMAACVENLGLQPLVAILDLGEWWHALVGCWDPPEPGLEAVRYDTAALLERALWLDPTAVTRDAELRRPFEAARAEAKRLLRERPLLFALDVAAARGEEIMPLPFAGQPAWSAAVSRAIEAAHGRARAAGGQLCSAALLAGLLVAGDGLTRTVVGGAVGDPARAAEVVVGSLPAAPPAPQTSPGYRQVLEIARARAKAAGSPVVLEAHLLGALLLMRSGSLEWALGKLGTDQPRLMRALRDLEDGADPVGSTYHGTR